MIDEEAFGSELAVVDARALTEQIKAGLENVGELIIKAFKLGAWSALGYDTWDDYCAEEFQSKTVRVSRDVRRELVGSMRGEGLSTRAIASGLGVDKRTVSRDLKKLESNGANAPMPPERVTTTDGRTYPAKRPQPEPELVEAELEPENKEEQEPYQATPQPQPTAKPVPQYTAEQIRRSLSTTPTPQPKPLTKEEEARLEHKEFCERHAMYLRNFISGYPLARDIHMWEERDDILACLDSVDRPKFLQYEKELHNEP